MSFFQSLMRRLSPRKKFKDSAPTLSPSCLNNREASRSRSASVILTGDSDNFTNSGT